VIEATDGTETVDGRYTECRRVVGVGAAPVAASCLTKKAHAASGYPCESASLTLR